MKGCVTLRALFVFILATLPVARAQQGSPPMSAGSNTNATNADSPKISVGRNVQVSKAYEKNAHYETLVAASATDPNTLLGCGVVRLMERPELVHSYSRTVVYHSADGGKTWTPGLDVDRGERRIDPACAFGLDNDAYFVDMVHDQANQKGPFDYRYYIQVRRSPDAGQTWQAPVVLGLPFADRPYISVDRTASKYRGRIYVHALGFLSTIGGNGTLSCLKLFFSVDRGQHFEEKAVCELPNSGSIVSPGNSVVLSDGTLVIAFRTRAPRPREENWGAERAWLKVIRTPNGGESFEPASTVSDFFEPLFGHGTEGRSLSYLAADPGSSDFLDRLYVVWTDKRFGRLRIMFSYSADKGKTWSRPKVVDEGEEIQQESEQGGGPDNFLPTVEVNRDGVVGVAWYDRRETPDNLGWRLRFTASLDGGETFLPSVWVSETPNTYGKNTEWIVNASAYPRSSGSTHTFQFLLTGFFYDGGDTSGMTVNAAGVFYPFWVDNRTGVSQLWTAPVTVNGKVSRNGLAELRDFIDVTSKMEIEFSNLSYDRAEDLLHATIRLKNTSRETIEGPLKMRALGFRQRDSLGDFAVGTPEVIGAGTGEDRRKGLFILDLTGLMQDNRLRPGELTQARRLTFRLSNVQPLRQGKRINRRLVSFDARILARTSSVQ